MEQVLPEPEPASDTGAGESPLLVPPSAASFDGGTDVLSLEFAQLEEDDLETQRKKAVLKGLRQDIKARKRYAKCIFRLIVCWLIAILILLLLQGLLSDRSIKLSFHLFHSHWQTKIGFKLSDPVLLALIGGTTANVLGLFFFVVQYLFPKRSTGATESLS